MAVVRRLVKDDGPAWRRIRLEALEACPTAFAMSFEQAAQQDLATFTAHIPLPDQPRAIFGAFESETLCGTAGFHIHERPKQRHKGELWGVYVAPPWRRHGLGAMLLDAVIAHARAHVVLLQLSVGTDNAAACALYRGLGFVTYGRERRALCVDGVYYDQELMAMDFV
jgi:ribosomal protein S18 acetylase RimI-like enzyme